MPDSTTAQPSTLLDARDEFASRMAQALIIHHMKHPANLTTADFNFDMEDRAGTIAHQAYQMADAMLYARSQKTHITP